MISLILYGRNDNYGYNLHKRAALSLNCMAEVLSDPDDEILFVDYNTPDDFPTFPEAIQDTLTEQAIRLLRIFRVRPSVHARFRSRSHLVALEPIARNVALRRSNPANRWILSTNTDMIFVPRRAGEDLTAIARDLPSGYWGAPRFELPETLWESFDRRDPAGVIGLIDRWGWDYHLNEIVYGAEYIRFDAPGDFQLMPRADLFAIHGFHEGMLIGWHVDSNIARRMTLRVGKPGDLSDRIFGYHCDHTRQVTPMHKREAVENSIEDFVFGVTRPELPAQAASWGCPDDPIEEIRLSQRSTSDYVTALQELLGTHPLESPLTADYTGSSWDQTGYTPQHVLPFLLDLFASVPRCWSIAWIGGHQSMFDLFAAAWQHLRFSGRILVPTDLPGAVVTEGAPAAKRVPCATIEEQANVFVFDNARADGRPLSADMSDGDEALLAAVEAMLRRMLSYEALHRARRQEPRRFVCINAVHNRFERIFGKFVATARTPFCARLRHGFVYPADMVADEIDYLIDLTAGAAGEVVDGRIHSRPLVPGLVATGPKAPLPPGRYEARLTLPIVARSAPPFALSTSSKSRLYRQYRRLPWQARRIIRSVFVKRPEWLSFFADRPPLQILVEVTVGPRPLAAAQISSTDLLNKDFHLQFELLPAHFGSDGTGLVDVRVVSNGTASFSIEKFKFVQLAQATNPAKSDKAVKAEA